MNFSTFTTTKVKLGSTTVSYTLTFVAICCMQKFYFRLFDTLYVSHL